MSSSTSFVLDGVEFKISDAFLVHRMVELPPDFDIKDPEVLLEEYEYDFSVEKHLLLVHHAQERKLEEQKRQEQQEKERLKQELAEKHRQYLLQKENFESQQKLDSSKNSAGNTQGSTISSTNPFLKDMVSSDILTPQKYTNIDKHESPKKVDVHEFENDNQDPFSNMELQTIDDIKELQDVLQNVTMSGSMETTSTITPNTRIRHHSPTNKNDEVSIKLTKKNEDDTQASTSKTAVIEELTDLLTDDVTYTESSPGNTPPSQKKTFKTVSSASKTTSTSRYMDGNENYVSVVSSGSLPVLNNSMDMQSDESSMSVSISRPTSLTNIDSTKDTSNVNKYVNDTMEFKDTNVPPPTGRTSPTFSIKAENEYVNVSITSLPKLPPKPLPRSSVQNSGHRKSPEHSTSSQTDNSYSTYGAVKKKVLANKSKAERDKFEETINKALTSLPQLPAIVTKKKNTERSSSPLNQTSNVVPVSPGVLAGLSLDERNFVHSIVRMGFKEQDVIRTMQKHGENHKEVLDRLCMIQRLSEKKFAISNIEEALDLFNEDEQEAEKYLSLERQFLDMGFSGDKVKHALLLHDRNQSKALEELMSGV